MGGQRAADETSPVLAARLNDTCVLLHLCWSWLIFHPACSIEHLTMTPVRCFVFTERPVPGRFDMHRPERKAAELAICLSNSCKVGCGFNLTCR